MKKFVRSVRAILFFTLFGIGAGVISFVIFPFISFAIKKDNQKAAYSAVVSKAWNFFIKDLIKAGIIDIKIPDKEKFENLSGKIIVANHPTFIDIVILTGMIPKSTCLAKKETLKNPLFRNIVKSIFIINNIDLDKLKTDTDKYLKKGFNIIIFPAGTRTKQGENFKIHKGPAAIALNSGAEIITVKITTDFPFLQKGQLFCDIGEKTVQYTIKIEGLINPSDYAHLPEIKARNAITEQIKKQII